MFLVRALHPPRRNRSSRNWPIYGYLGYELVRKPRYNTMLRIQDAALTIMTSSSSS
jgi:hypothetical protein